MPDDDLTPALRRCEAELAAARARAGVYASEVERLRAENAVLRAVAAVARSAYEGIAMMDAAVPRLGEVLKGLEAYDQEKPG